jgi:hypothetical protein
MVQAGSKRDKTLTERLEWALGHADPDIRALAEALIDVRQRLDVIDRKLGPGPADA